MVLQGILIINVAALIIKHAYFKIQIIDQAFNHNQFSIEDLLREREKCWEAQLLTDLYGMNNINDF